MISSKIPLKMMWVCFAPLILFAPFAVADTYFLKFETSNATPAPGTTVSTLASDNGAWMDVSIVTSPAADGNVHWPNSQVGSTVGSGNENKKAFYLANVPRSLTIMSHDGTSTRVITAGASAENFPGAPSFLLPDGFLVATGLGNKIVIAAFPGLRPMPHMHISCPEGWYFHKSSKVRIVEASVSTTQNPNNFYEARYQCGHVARYIGDTPYAVLSE